MRISRRRFFGLMSGGVAAGSAYVFGVEPIWIETNELELSLPRLDPAFDGYTVAHISDLHAGEGVPKSHLDRAVETANSFQPDLLVVTGDIVDNASERGAPKLAAAVLARAEATDGVFAVHGNHDTGSYYDGCSPEAHAIPRLEDALAGAGVNLLCNEARVLHRGRAELRIAGYGDLWSGAFDAQAVNRGGCTIALSHSPDTAPALARRGTDLVLSGHTHGGQVCFPLFGPPWIPLKHKQFLQGHFHIGDTQLYVNRGLGWTHRIRLRARPEVTILTLRAKTGSAAPRADRRA